MPVPVMGIRNMRAAVPQPFAAMAVAVRTCGHDLVSVLVAAVFVAVRMFVLPCWYCPIRQSLGSVCLRQGQMRPRRR